MLDLKALCLLSGAVLLMAAGCQKKPEAPAPATTTNAGGSVATAPVDYLSALAKGKQSAAKTVDTVALEKAIQLFGVENGRNPKDLNELVQKKFIPQIPEPPYGMKIVYDANNGTVKLEKQ